MNHLNTLEAEIEGAPFSAAQVRAQMEQILASDFFLRSKRTPGLFRHIVEETLRGNIDSLKERILGIEVFGRTADYDQAEDPVVRVAAGDLRRRLAQYYVLASHRAEIRIELPVGSYVARFLPADFTATVTEPNMIASFWKPVLDAASTPIIAMASLDGAVEWHKLASETSKVRRTTTQNLVVPEDVTALSLVIELFHAQKQRFKLATANATSLSDLRSGPNVLIGNYNNRWTIRFLSETPFVPRLPDEGFIFGIRDTRVENPHTWSVNLGGEVAGIDTDYGLITRFINPATNQPTVALGGIGPYATIGAAEFLTNPIFFHQFCRQAPQKWTEHNLQIVIRLDVVDGCPGPPQILASAFW